MYQTEYFCYTCEIELEQHTRNVFSKSKGVWTERDFFTCLKCSRIYVFLFFNHQIKNKYKQDIWEMAQVPEELRPYYDFMWLTINVVLWLPFYMIIIFQILIEKDEEE